MQTKNNKIWTIFVPILFICLMTFLSFSYGSLCNQVYLGGVKIFSKSYQMYHIKSTVPSVIKEELIWRFVPLFSISCVIHMLKYETKKYKNIVLLVCFAILLVISAQFGYKHYNPILESKEMIMVHIMMQGVMGLLYAVAYNVSQTYVFKRLKNERPSILLSLSLSHITGLLSSMIVHLLTNISLIIRYTF